MATQLDKPGVRRVYPLEVGDYDDVKAQVMRYYRTRRRSGPCRMCHKKDRHTWRMTLGEWTVTCCKCKRSYRAKWNGDVEIDGFGKWIFPVIKNMSALDVIDQIVAVQPMTDAEADYRYEVEGGGARAGRLIGYGPGNIQEIARGHRHQTPEEDYCPICRAIDELAAKNAADAGTILLRAGQEHHPRPPAATQVVPTLWLDIIYGRPRAAPDLRPRGPRNGAVR